MGLRFRKSIKICKGVRVNLGKTGASFSFGTRGLRRSIHTSGRTTTSVGIPGTGIYYTTTSGGRKKTSRKRATTNTRTNRTAQLNNVTYEQRVQERENAKVIEEYNNLLERIRSIHKNCDDKIDWEEVSKRVAPYEKNERGPMEIEAQNKVDTFKVRFYEKWFKSLEEKRYDKLVRGIEEAKEKDIASYKEWENLQELSYKVLQGDIESYLYVVDEMKPFDDLLDFGSDFEVGTDNKDLLEIEFCVKSDKVVPKHVLSLTKTGKLSSKAMSKTQHYDILQDYVCSCAIRVARDSFALLPVKYVIVHAVDTVLDTAIGSNDEITVLSVKFDREQFDKTNFEYIDPSDMIERFKHNMNFRKTMGFKAVDRISD